VGSLLVSLIPYAIGMAVTPSAIAAGILFLSSERPVTNALSFSAAFAVLYSALAMLVIGVSAAQSEPVLSDDDKAVVDVVVGGALLVLVLVKVVRSRRREGPATAPRWLAAVDRTREPQAFGIGLVIAVLNPNIAFLLGGLAACAAADLSGVEQAAGAAVLVGASLIGLVGPVLWYVLDRGPAERGLAHLKDFLTRHEVAVDATVLGLFGVMFVFKGLSALA
jgi:hypothetical protein